jgi:glutamyl/glutaminyl-tRNA synthetase
LRDRVAAMQRRTFALQAGATTVTEAPDPIEERPDALARVDLPALVAVGEHDKPDFIAISERLARELPDARFEVIERSRTYTPIDQPERLAELIGELEDIDPWTAESTEAAVRSFAERKGVKLGQVAQPLRAALTGRVTSPGIFEVLEVLGQPESLARLADQAAGAARSAAE